MNPVKITKRIVDKLSPCPDGKSRSVIWDSDMKNFGIRVFPSGSKVFFAYYRTTAGSQRWYSIGKYGVLTVKQAREQAGQVLAAVAHGEDPAGQKRAMRSAIDFSDFSEKYFSDYAEVRKKPKSVVGDRSLWSNYIKDFLGSRKVASIKTADIERLHVKLKDKPFTANRCLALLSKMFALAERWGYVEGPNPCRGISKYKETVRNRFLSRKDLIRLGVALARVERLRVVAQPIIDVIRLLLLTGARSGEIMNLRWDDVNLERQCLQLRDSKSGPREIILNPAAVAVLKAMDRDPSGWVIPGKNGARLKQFVKSWKRICRMAKLKNFRVHDLRHSHASIGVSLHLGLPVIGTLLGHKHASTTQRYAHLHDDPLRAASAAIGAAISEFMKLGAAKVISLHPEKSDAENSKA